MRLSMVKIGGRFLTKQLISLCCFALAGCLLNTDQVRVTPDHVERIKVVGVISLLNRQPNISYLSTSAMDSNFSTAVLEGWDADRMVHEQLGSRLKRKGLEVVHISRNAPGLGASESDSTWGYVSTDGMREHLFAVGAAKGVDMLVVVYPHVEKDFVTNTNQNIRGYGLQRAFDSDPFAYAAVYVEAVDVKKQFVAGQSEGLQVAPLEDEVWREGFETTAGPQAIGEWDRASVSQAISKVLTDAIGSAARESGL